MSAATSSTLETELESIKELHGVEPDNKCKFAGFYFVKFTEKNNQEFTTLNYFTKWSIIFELLSVL